MGLDLAPTYGTKLLAEIYLESIGIESDHESLSLLQVRQFIEQE